MMSTRKSYRYVPSIHCSMGSAPVGVHCHLHHRSPHATIMRLTLECVDFLSASFLDVIEPFSARSSSPRLSRHHSKHHVLEGVSAYHLQPIVLHHAYIAKQV